MSTSVDVDDFMRNFFEFFHISSNDFAVKDRGLIARRPSVECELVMCEVVLRTDLCVTRRISKLNEVIFRTPRYAHHYLITSWKRICYFDYVSNKLEPHYISL